MDITGIWKYSELKKQYNAVVAELNTVKKTATQLTHENMSLRSTLDSLREDRNNWLNKCINLEKEAERSELATLKRIERADEIIDRLHKEIDQLKKEACELKWGYHEMLTADGIRIAGWIPIEGTAYQILSKTPAMFPQFCKEKQVPEK